jgi:CubicO group peptidase (beta-lactamase class C family)
MTDPATQHQEAHATMSVSRRSDPMFVGADAAPVWPKDRPKYQSLAAAVQGEAARWNVPGIAAGIVQDGHVEVVTTGFANLKTKQPVFPETLFQIGSISKIYTATLCQILADEDLLDLDAPISTYIPDFTLQDANAAKAITLRDTISHQGGFEGDQFDDQGLGDDALAKSVATAKDWKQWVQPRELWFYNNAGFYLAGRAIELVTGETFEHVLTEKLLKPLGVPNTVLFTHDAIVRPHAVGHDLADRKAGFTIAEPFAIPRHATAAGYVMAPVGELLRFAQLHLNDGEIDGTRIVSAERTREMREPQIEAANFADYYATGWAIEDFGETRLVSHGGSTNGFRAHLDLVPGSGFAIAILTNGSTGAAAYDQIKAWALKHYRNVKREQPKPVRLGKAALEKRAGKWTRHNAELTITVDGDRLAATLISISPLTGKQTGADRVFHLEPVSDTDYYVVDAEGGGESWQFVDLEPDRLGKTRHLLRLHGRLVEREAPDGEAKKAARSNKKKK